MKNFIAFFLDLFYIIKGKYTKNKTTEYKYAFLVHSRNYKDIYRKYPGFKFIPKKVVFFIMNHLWPITLSRITGLNSAIQDEKELKGYVIGIPMTADQMMRQRSYALKKIRQALYLAKGKGVRIIGLGGLTSSLSRGGLDLVDIDINITTGHAYTAYNIFRNISKMTEIIEIPKNKIKIAVVGAAGSVGSTVSLLIARDGYSSITLIDLKRKEENVSDLENQIKKINPSMEVNKSYSVSNIADCDFVITATNTPEALITNNIVRGGMVIIDDAQPSDIHPNVLKLEDVLVIEAGVVHTPGIKSNFDYGLKNKTDNFCCMAELLILASHKWKKHYVINRAKIEEVDEISKMGDDLGFTLASFQNFLESISYDKIEHVKALALKKHGITI